MAGKPPAVQGANRFLDCEVDNVYRFRGVSCDVRALGVAVCLFILGVEQWFLGIRGVVDRFEGQAFGLRAGEQEEEENGRRGRRDRRGKH